MQFEFRFEYPYYYCLQKYLYTYHHTTTQALFNWPKWMDN